MFSLLGQGLSFVKKNPALLFSLALVIIIPLLIFLLSSFLTKSFQENIDLTLQQEAMVIQEVLSPYVSEYYGEPELLQERIEYLTEQNSDLSQLKILLPTEKGSFKIIASQDPGEKEKKVSGTSFLLSWQKDQAIAFLSREEGVRFWNVIKPFYSSGGEKIGLMSLSLSLERADNLITREFKKAYLFAVLAIVLILFLVVQHTRLFQYVDLFNKLRQTEKSKDSFMNMAIHELRSPVVNIKNYISELQEEVGPALNEEQKEDMKRVVISVRRLNNLISDILDVVRIEQKRLTFAPENILPVDFVKEVINELKGKALAKSLKIEFIEQGKVGGMINVNPGRFREILYNLIDNAIKYTQKGGIRVTVKEDVQRAKFYIIIEDTGIGISAEEQSHLFERFYRVRNKDTVDIEGTGLGLWIVKQLCVKMRGRVLVESIKGVGSKFTLIFPLIKQ